MPKKDKLTKAQRLELGRQLYYNEISRQEAVEKYGVNVYTIRYYMRNYRDANKLPPKVPYGIVAAERRHRISFIQNENLSVEQDHVNEVPETENN